MVGIIAQVSPAIPMGQSVPNEFRGQAPLVHLSLRERERWSTVVSEDDDVGDGVGVQVSKPPIPVAFATV